jgi:hypothetical protein
LNRYSQVKYKIVAIKNKTPTVKKIVSVFIVHYFCRCVFKAFLSTVIQKTIRTNNSGILLFKGG